MRCLKGVVFFVLASMLALGTACDSGGGSNGSGSVTDLGVQEALGGGIYFILGDPFFNSVISVVAQVDSSKARTYMLTMQTYVPDTGGVGYEVRLVPCPAPPCTCQNQTSPPEAGGMLYLGGSDNVTRVLFQMTDKNGFNTTNTIHFAWMDTCHKMAYIIATPK